MHHIDSQGLKNPIKDVSKFLYLQIIQQSHVDKDDDCKAANEDEDDS
jgi:hypothetical protein